MKQTCSVQRDPASTRQQKRDASLQPGAEKKRARHNAKPSKRVAPSTGRNGAYKHLHTSLYKRVRVCMNKCPVYKHPDAYEGVQIEILLTMCTYVCIYVIDSGREKETREAECGAVSDHDGGFASKM